jgi:predicted methyltransferase
LIVVISFNDLVTRASAQQNLDLNDLKEALTSFGRTPSDLARDSIRKPIETLQFIGIK